MAPDVKLYWKIIKHEFIEECAEKTLTFCLTISKYLLRGRMVDARRFSTFIDVLRRREVSDGFSLVDIITGMFDNFSKLVRYKVS